MGDDSELGEKLLEMGLIDTLVVLEVVPPTVDAYRFGSGLKVPCIYCQAFHVHGSAGDGGHRVAHCKGDSGYADSGYNLVIVGDFTLEIQQKFRDFWAGPWWTRPVDKWGQLALE